MPRLFAACVYLLRGVWTHICQAASGARRHLFSACGELTNTQEEASKLVYVGLVVAEAQPDACPVGSSGTPPLTFVGVIEHGGSTLCLLVHKHRPSFLLIVCVSVCVCNLVPWAHFNSVSISHCTWGSWWRSGTRATLPTQHQKLLMSYCCTLLWNIIALWCVNKAGACCHSICSPAGQTRTREWGRRWGGEI